MDARQLEAAAAAATKLETAQPIAMVAQPVMKQEVPPQPEQIGLQFNVIDNSGVLPPSYQTQSTAPAPKAFCGTCGAQNKSGGAFCASCGTQFELTQL